MWTVGFGVVGLGCPVAAYAFRVSHVHLQVWRF